MMADGRVVEIENLKKVLDAISEIKKKKQTIDDRILKIVKKNNKNSYRIVQETHLDKDCVIGSQIDKTLKSTDVVKDLSIRLDKTSHDNLTNLANDSGCSKLKCRKN